MIYVTGDMHGDITRFKQKTIKQLKKTDVLIICGDFGFVWNGSDQEKKQLEWIGRRRFTTLFIDGVHENFDLLDQYPEQELYGGRVRGLGKRLFYLQRGQVYEIEGKRIFVMGGGESIDKESRAKLSTYWAQEMPTAAEIEEAAYRLEDNNFTVDYIFTYEAATTILSSVRKDFESISPLNAFLERVLRQCSYRKWFFGCYHIDRKLSTVQHAVFKEVLPVEEIVPHKK